MVPVERHLEWQWSNIGHAKATKMHAGIAWLDFGLACVRMPLYRLVLEVSEQGSGGRGLANARRGLFSGIQ